MPTANPTFANGSPLPSPSRITVAGLGVHPLKSPVPARDLGRTEQWQCTMCGVLSEPNDLADEFRPGAGFLDHFDRPHTHHNTICADCAIVVKKPIMDKLKAFCATPDGVYPILKDVHRAWLFTAPPKPPFVVGVADAQLQHLVWRIPLTLHKDLLQVRFGRRVLQIDRPLMLEALHIQESAGVPLWQRLDRNLDDPRHGLPHGKNQARLSGEQQQILAMCGPGELWGLATLAKKTPPTPEKPEPINIDQAKLEK